MGLPDSPLMLRSWHTSRFRVSYLGPAVLERGARFCSEDKNPAGHEYDIELQLDLYCLQSVTGGMLDRLHRAWLRHIHFE